MKEWKTLSETAAISGLSVGTLKQYKLYNKFPVQNVLEVKSVNEGKQGRPRLMFLVDTSKPYIKHEAQKKRYAK